MLKKPPLTDFNSDSVKSLPEEAQRKIKENRDKIFKEGITYQEQIEAVIKLIYSPNRKDHLGQTAISKLFGHPFSVNGEIKKVNCWAPSITG